MAYHPATLERPTSSPSWMAVIFGLLAVMSGLALALLHGGLAVGAATSGFNPLYAFSGLLVGALVGLTGVGGGSLMTPLLVLLFGFHPSTAVGTDLLYASATKCEGTLIHNDNRTVDWAVTRRLAFGSVPATVLTVLALYELHLKTDAAGKLISAVMGAALLLTAATLMFRRRIFAFAAKRSFAPPDGVTFWLTVGLGAVLGVLITVSSVGAGAIGVTLLVLLYPKMPVARIVGSDIAHAVPLTLIAGAGHFAMGSVNLPLLGSLLVGSIPGVALGSQFTARIPETYLRPMLAATLTLVGLKMLF